ncbi:MAG: zinc protease [Abditibacteriota bacterium]|nr:zinc protease [Abditibacteriota bacterium]
MKRAHSFKLKSATMKPLFPAHSKYFVPLVLGVCALQSAGRAAVAPEVRHTFANGLTLVSRLDRTSPRVAISLVVRAGAADETPQNAGWRRLLVDAMLRSARKPASIELTGDDTQADANGFWKAAQLQRAAEEAGGQLGAAVGDDVIEFYATGNSAGAARLASLLLSLVREPQLSDADIDASRKALLERLDAERADVATLATNELRGRLYRDARGELAAYGLPPTGTVDSLNALTNDRVRELFRTFFGANNWTLSAAVDIDFASLKTSLETVPATTQGPASSSVPFFVMPDASQPNLVVRQTDTPSTWVFVAHPIASAPLADWPALRVLAALLGDSSRARLPRRLLDGRLTLGGGPAAQRVVVQFTPRRFRGELVAFAETETSQAERIKNAMLDELRRLKDARVTSAELTAAKNYVRGAWAVDREGLHERAYQSALAAALSPASGRQSTLTTDASWSERVARVTSADVQRVAKKYLQGYAVALIMPQE